MIGNTQEKLGGQVKKNIIGQRALCPSLSSIGDRMMQVIGWLVHIRPHVGRLSSEVKPGEAW
jgi:hypothetical protein